MGHYASEMDERQWNQSATDHQRICRLKEKLSNCILGNLRAKDIPFLQALFDPYSHNSLTPRQIDYLEALVKELYGDK